MGPAWYIGARLARLPGLPHTVASGLVVGYRDDPLLGHVALAFLISWVGVAGLRCDKGQQDGEAAGCGTSWLWWM